MCKKCEKKIKDSLLDYLKNVQKEPGENNIEEELKGNTEKELKFDEAYTNADELLNTLYYTNEKFLVMLDEVNELANVFNNGCNVKDVYTPSIEVLWQEYAKRFGIVLSAFHNQARALSFFNKIYLRHLSLQKMVELKFNRRVVINGFDGNGKKTNDRDLFDLFSGKKDRDLFDEFLQIEKETDGSTSNVDTIIKESFNQGFEVNGQFDTGYANSTGTIQVEEVDKATDPNSGKDLRYIRANVDINTEEFIDVFNKNHEKIGRLFMNTIEKILAYKKKPEESELKKVVFEFCGYYKFAMEILRHGENLATFCSKHINRIEEVYEIGVKHLEKFDVKIKKTRSAKQYFENLKKGVQPDEWNEEFNDILHSYKKDTPDA